ncbi:MAG: methylated-DNA--[protein]-cysteine S-methyltransferase [Dermatophilaceae bacterium]
MTSPFAFTPTITAPVFPESDVSYAELDTAVGRLLLATAGGRLVLCAYAAGETEEQAHLARVAAAVSPRVLRLNRPLDDARRQVEDYLAGRRHDFDVATSLAVATPFQDAVADHARFAGACVVLPAGGGVGGYAGGPAAKEKLLTLEATAG